MTRTSALATAFAMGAAALALPTVGHAEDTQQAMNAKFTIGQAVDAAEAKGMGKATEVDFDDDNGGRWEVKILADGGNKLTEYYVDATSGQITGQEEQTFEKYFTMLKPEDFQKAPTQIKAAIMAAETAGNGKAINAEVEREGQSVSYEIDVATADGSKKDVKVDANGKAILD